jgi:hypothetical protein
VTTCGKRHDLASERLSDIKRPSGASFRALEIQNNLRNETTRSHYPASSRPGMTVWSECPWGRIDLAQEEQLSLSNGPARLLGAGAGDRGPPALHRRGPSHPSPTFLRPNR